MNETGSSKQLQSKSGRAARRAIVVVVLAAAVVGAAVLARSRLAKSATSAGATFVARRGNLTITVTEGGSIRASKSIEYKCEVQRRGVDVTILSVVPAGEYITQEDVRNGKVLVKLDSSALEEQLTREKMDLTSASENMTSAKEAFEIQKIQNESDRADGLLQVRFAMMDLQRYLGNELAAQLTEDVSAITNLSEHVAPILRQARNDPNILDGSASGQELKRLNDDIVLAQGNLKNAQNTLIGTERLHEANYVSDLDLERDRLTVVNRQFSLENAIVNRDLFMRYDLPKSAEQYLSAYIEAGRKLERTYAQCRSRLAQAQASLSSATERYRSQELRVQEQEKQIANCTIRAKAPGLVIYGTGSSADAFRAMRGRGGVGGSGMIAEGETVYEGQTILSMPDTASMIAEISVHETEVDKIRAGQYAEIVMDAFPDRRLQGRVLEVAPLPDQQQGFLNPDLKVYKTLVSIDGTHDFLKTRMSCKVEILVRELEDVILAPIQVVANRRGKKVVYVLNTSGGSEEREVTTGAFNDTFVEIVSGLNEGEAVLLNPPLLTDGGSAAFQQQRMRLPDGFEGAPENGGGPVMGGSGQRPEGGGRGVPSGAGQVGAPAGMQRPERSGERMEGMQRPVGAGPDGAARPADGSRPARVPRPEGTGFQGGPRSARPEGSGDADIRQGERRQTQSTDPE